MNRDIDSINQILPNASAGTIVFDDDDEANPTLNYGQKAQAIRRWIRSVLSQIIQYQDEHRRLLNEAATTLQLVFLSNNDVTNEVLPFLQLPSYTFEVGGDHQDVRRLNVELLRIDDSDKEEE